MSRWIDRCPQGHASIRRHRQRGGYRCAACDITYAGEPYDAREVDEFPVEADGETGHATLGKVDYDAILAAVVDVVDRPERSWVKTREVDVSSRRAGFVLRRLEADGLVRRRGMSDCTEELWKPTPVGRQRVAGGETA